jgi:SHS2 domain-containing protein
MVITCGRLSTGNDLPMLYEIPDCDVEELGHTSEIGLRARAPTLADLFGCLAQAMVGLTGVEAEPEADPVFFEVELTAGDLESLLVDWLNEVLYLHEVSGLVPEAVEIDEITLRSIQATLRGHRSRQAPDLQIKAVTYHQLWIGQEQERQETERWKAEVFFDI